MKRFLEKTVENEMIRYLFFGVCTTVVNLGVFTILRYGMCMEMQTANLISILVAILFAFSVNKWFVFQSEEMDLKTVFAEFLNFTGMRCMTLLVEFWGVYALVTYVYVSDLISKLIIQVVVVALNYVISKCYVFREKAV